MGLSRRVFVTLLAGVGVLSKTAVDRTEDTAVRGYGGSYGTQYSGTKRSEANCGTGADRAGGD